jgi:hypothetical protein
MAHAYTTKRGKNKKAKLGVRKDHQQNLEKALKNGPGSLSAYLYDGPKESALGVAGHLGYSSSTTQGRLESVKSRLQKALMDKCSNTDCTNAQEGCHLSECSACHQTRYCCKDCQKAHWPAHKELCKSIRKKLQEEEEERQQKVLNALQELNIISEMTDTVTTDVVANVDDVAATEEHNSDDDDNNNDDDDDDAEDINDIN